VVGHRVGLDGSKDICQAYCCFFGTVLRTTLEQIESQCANDQGQESTGNEPPQQQLNLLEFLAVLLSYEKENVL
jgi:hypothetical protein